MPSQTASVHSFLKPEKIVATALGLLEREIVLTALVNRYTEADFKGVKNDTINIPIRARLAAREINLRATGSGRNLTSDDLSEGSTPLRLTKNAYSSVFVTDEELTLDIENFAYKVLEPQVRAVAEKLETYIMAEIAAGAYVKDLNSIEWDVSAEDAFAKFVKCRTVLTKANVLSGRRVALVGPGALESVLTDSKLQPGPNPTGLGESALREATIGRLAGFDLFESVLVPDNKVYIVTPDSFLMGNVAPVVPDSVKFGARMTNEDFSMRWIKDYDSATTQERSLVNSYIGTAEVADGVVPASWTAPSGYTDYAVGDPYNARAIEITLV